MKRISVIPRATAIPADVLARIKGTELDKGAYLDKLKKQAPRAFRCTGWGAWGFHRSHAATPKNKKDPRQIFENAKGAEAVRKQ